MAPTVLKTYGKITTNPKGGWRIECEPHVRIRLKNLFGGSVKGTNVAVLLSDTDDICRDILWFCDRYPLSMSPKVLAGLEAGAQRQRQRVEAVNQILSGNFQLPSVEMAMPARGYQEQAAAALFNRGNLLLVDQLGLGKTVSAIRVMADPKALPALVVVPSPLTYQWVDEISRFVPGLRVHRLKGGAPYDLTDKDGNDPHVIVTSYHKLRAWSDHFRGKMKLVVFDEVQELRTGADAQKNIAAADVAREAQYRLGLTATPVYNYGGEIFNILDVLSPDSLGSRGEFEREWCSDGGRKASIRDPHGFSSYLREAGLMLCRTRNDVGRELPPINTMIHSVDCEKTDAFWDAQTAAAEMAKIVLDNAAKNFDRMQAGAHLDAMVRQATGVAKAPGVAALVRMIVEQDEKVVLFGWHREVYEIWKQLLGDLDPAWYTGTESPAKKRKEVLRFVEGDARVIIMSLRSGTGLNRLPEVCATAVHGELDWSPGVHEQCNGRLHRDGQDRPVFAHYPIADSGSDPIVCDVLGIKRGQVEGIRNPTGAAVVQRQVDPGHIKRLAEDYLKNHRRRKS